MGVEYSAVIIVGLPKSELALDYDEIDLSFISQYYDGSEGIVGCVVSDSGCYSYEELGGNFVLDVVIAHQLFTEATGRVGKLYLSTRGY